MSDQNQKKFRILGKSQRRYFKLSPKLIDQEDDIFKQEILSRIRQPPFRQSGSLKFSEDRIGVLKRFSHAPFQTRSNFLQLMSRSFLIDNLQNDTQKMGYLSKMVSSYTITKNKLRNLPIEFEGILRDTRTSLTYSFNHNKLIYAANLKSFKLILQKADSLLHELQLNMGWTRYITQRVDTQSLQAIMRECVTVQNDRIKLQEGKLFKKCKGINTENHYQNIASWQKDGKSIRLEIPLIEIMNPEIKVYEVLVPENKQILISISKGLWQAFIQIKKRIDIGSMLQQRE